MFITKCFDANPKNSFNFTTTYPQNTRTVIKKQEAPKLTYKIKGHYKPYNSTLKRCKLCLYENLAIIDDPDKSLLNKR